MVCLGRALGARPTGRGGLEPHHDRFGFEVVVEALDAGRRSTDELLDAAWGDVPEPMRPAAALAMRAHLEKLEAEGRLPSDLEL